LRGAISHILAIAIFFLILSISNDEKVGIVRWGGLCGDIIQFGNMFLNIFEAMVVAFCI
jgi:hypothetical protein